MILPEKNMWWIDVTPGINNFNDTLYSLQYNY
jgi:hypothetical protein